MVTRKRTTPVPAAAASPSLEAQGGLPLVTSDKTCEQCGTFTFVPSLDGGRCSMRGAGSVMKKWASCPINQFTPRTGA